MHESYVARHTLLPYLTSLACLALPETTLEDSDITALGCLPCLHTLLVSRLSLGPEGRTETLTARSAHAAGESVVKA